MPRLKDHLVVFVASPGDVAEERAVLEEIVNELNRTWGDSMGVHLELVRWETHTYPDIADEAQTVVERQIGSEYDIFIGILWSRFGTPTKRFASGTEQEFHTALKKYKESNAVTIMLYFKDSPIPLEDIEPEQVRLVKNFRKSAPGFGTLHWTYPDLDTFRNLLRMHLSRKIQDWRKSKGTMPEVKPQTLAPVVKESAATQSTQNDVINLQDEESGLMDLVETSESAMRALTDILKRIANGLTALSDSMNEGTAALPNAQSFSDKKELINQAADDMDTFSVILEKETPLLSPTLQESITAITKCLYLSKDLGTEGSKLARQISPATLGLKEAIIGAKDSLSRFRPVVAGLPRLTSKLSSAKRRLVSALDNQLAQLSKSVIILDELLKFIDGQEAN